MVSGDGLARGFAYSIYLMIVLAYGTLGAFVFFLWRAWRRKPSPPSSPTPFPRNGA